ncbi:NAD(P)H-binding protein [Streptomyces chartreusis]|uniref:NAD(P)H-binding protein n=1 Tax=Streptomyces chartreusis TaxID=1969 RepID=UPI002E81C67F|nr:NAD(P)H-binding protein [Streptomyces chartreusis]WUB22990.1 NAD(P)H-binding protein [Streptomyces chartreusis]
MIVVSAASGALGRLVVEQLLIRIPAKDIAVAVRSPESAAGFAARGIQVRRGDYDVPDTLPAAFEGADRLLLISSPELDPVRRTGHHRAAVDAARKVGVGAVVYTSFLDADTKADGVTAAHHVTEQALRDSGLGHTLLRHPFYSEAFLNAGLHSAVAEGELWDGTDGRGINTASRADLAEAAARVLIEDGHLDRAYDFTGARWTYPELAEVLTQVYGKPVRHRQRPEPTPGIQGWLEQQVRSGALERQTDDLGHILGRPPTALHQAVRELVPASGS